MMTSDSNICLENLIGFGDIDIDMEVKSEQDSEEENNFVPSECNKFDVEFIIPEQRNSEDSNEELSEYTVNDVKLSEFAVNDVKLSEFAVNDVKIANISQGSSDDYDIDIEDEPEVEIDDVTVQQELVEVALQPSLLLYVHKDKNAPDVPKLLDEVGKKQMYERQQNNNRELSETQILPVPVFDKHEDVFSSLTPNSMQNNSSVTAELRKVKRKSYREPLEPLNEIECSSDNINNTQNIDSNRSKVDKHPRCVDSNENNEEDTNSDCSDVFFDAPSPCNSNSDFKEQKHVALTIKRKRGRPRLKSSTYIEKFITKRKGKRKIAGTKMKSFKLKRKKSEVEVVEIDKKSKKSGIKLEEQTQYSDCSIEFSCKSESSDESSNEMMNDDCEVKDDSSKKVKKKKKDRNKPSIFDEVAMDYTVLNEDKPKEKPKRIRKRDKISRETAAQSKPESFDCTECGRKFKEKSHLATHARAHIDIRNFKCNKCGSLFKTKTNLFFHMKTHSDAPFTCEKCNKTYPERRMLMRHIRVVHSSQNMYSCDQCGRGFKSMHNLNLHYTLHTGVKPFTCNICNKSFVYKSTYIAHMKGHDADISFNCELCPKTYDNEAEFYIQKRRLCNHHSEARPWLCTVCGKGYPLKGTLKNHMKTHEPEKQFKCTECPKSFMKKQSFECHLKVHTGEQPQFMCDQCSQSYFNAFALKRHYLKHTSERKFVCEVCHKAFWMKDALKVHMRTHSNVKLFPCVQCPKAFAHKHTLDSHLRTHLDVEPYSCNVCQKTFIHKYNLVRHERQHVPSTDLSVVPPPYIPPGHQTIPISIMMLPAMPTSPPTTLQSYTINTACL